MKWNSSRAWRKLRHLEYLFLFEQRERNAMKLFLLQRLRFSFKTSLSCELKMMFTHAKQREWSEIAKNLEKTHFKFHQSFEWRRVMRTRNKEPIRVKIDNFRDSGFFLQVIFASSLKNIMIILRDLSASMRVRHDNEIQEHSASRSLFRSTRDDLCSVKLWKFLIVNTSKFRQHSTSILKNLTDSRRNPHSSLYTMAGWEKRGMVG